VRGADGGGGIAGQSKIEAVVVEVFVVVVVIEVGV